MILDLELGLLSWSKYMAFLRVLRVLPGIVGRLNYIVYTLIMTAIIKNTCLFLNWGL